MKEDMNQKQRKSMIWDYIPLGIVLIVAAIILLFFSDRLGTVTNASWACIKIPQEMVELQFLGLNFMASRVILTIVFVSLMGVAIEHMIEWSDKKAIESKR
ncbi:MAG: hypothetical protein V3V48_03535 [Candidatus Aminicenantaceae bacterium]